jgi:hypothetical protein
MREEQSRPGLDTLADYLEGLLSEQESREVERWVAEDATTAELLRELEELPGLLLAADPVEPMPADVVDRVDAALAEAALVRGGAHDAPAEPARPAAAPRRNDQGAGGVVVPLRRRRWLAPALSAAAMVGVVALGAQVVGSVGTGDSSSPTSADDAAAGSDEAESAGGLTAREQTGNAPGYTAGMLPPVRTDTFATDVADALTDPTTDLQRVDGVDVEEAAGLPSTLLSGDCPVDLGAGRFLPIRLDGDVAVLVLRRIPGEPGRREALAYSPRCPDGDEEGDLQPLVRAEITLP